MPRKILLPNTIERTLDHLTNFVEETNGVLLYRRHQDYCPVEAYFMTGVGDAGHVKSFQERLDVANEFFRLNPSYQIVKFHTHTKGTITRYGDYYARHFSQGDIDSIKYQLRRDEDFIALLVTPETKLVCGLDNPELVVVDDSPVRQQRGKEIWEELKAIASGLDKPLIPLRLTVPE